MGVIVPVLFCLLSLTCLGHSSDRHMICKEVGDVFNDVTSTDVQKRRHIGPAGKPGSKGERGFPGSKGQPGEVNDERLREIVRAAVVEETQAITAKVDKMEAQIQNLTTREKPVMCNDGVMHGGKCYWAEVHSSQDTTIAEAQEICAMNGSRLADIYGKNHYDELMNYLRAKLNRRSEIFVWTGMRKLRGNNVAQLSNGTPAPYTRQRSLGDKWDNAVARRTHVYLKVLRSTTDAEQGMGAIWPTWESYGALCQSE